MLGKKPGLPSHRQRSEQPFECRAEGALQFGNFSDEYASPRIIAQAKGPSV